MTAANKHLNTRKQPLKHLSVEELDQIIALAKVFDFKGLAWEFKEEPKDSTSPSKKYHQLIDLGEYRIKVIKYVYPDSVVHMFSIYRGSTNSLVRFPYIGDFKRRKKEFLLFLREQLAA